MAQIEANHPKGKIDLKKIKESHIALHHSKVPSMLIRSIKPLTFHEVAVQKHCEVCEKDRSSSPLAIRSIKPLTLHRVAVQKHCEVCKKDGSSSPLAIRSVKPFTFHGVAMQKHSEVCKIDRSSGPLLMPPRGKLVSTIILVEEINALHKDLNAM